MNATWKAALEAAARHTVTGTGLATGTGAVPIPADAGPIILGLALGQWLGILAFLAGLALSVLKEIPARRPPAESPPA